MMNAILTILTLSCVGLLSVHISNAQSENEMIQAYFDNLKARNYNPKIAPEGYDGHGSPIRVYSTMYLIDIHRIDDFNMEYRAQFYFRQSWNDSRLAYPDMDISAVLINDPEYIWTPDLFFVHERDGIKHILTTPNVYIKIKPDGEVKLSIRYSITFSCGMDFRKYPHDTQECTFHIESYAKTAEQLYLDWDPRVEEPVQKTAGINVLPFGLESIKYSTKDERLSFGNYRVLQVTLLFNRKVGFYITRLYVPFIILVILSWLSFWIKPKLAILRVPLLLVIMYIMLNIGSDISSFIPPAPYTKASDVWIAVCESLVFAAFLEYIFVSIVSRSEKKCDKKRSSSSSDPEAPMITDSDAKDKSVSSDKMNSAIQMIASRLSKNTKISKQIDTISKILFPLLFVLFNLIYWIVY